MVKSKKIYLISLALLMTNSSLGISATSQVKPKINSFIKKSNILSFPISEKAIKYAQAKMYYSSIELFTQSYLDEYSQMSISQKIIFLKEYSNSLIAVNNFAEAEKIYQKLLEYVTKYNGLNSPEYIEIQNNLAFLKAKKTRLDKLYTFRSKDLKEEQLYIHSVLKQENSLKLNPIENTEILGYFDKTQFCINQANYKQAILFANKALCLIEQNYGSKSLAYSYGLANLSDVYFENGYFRRSESIYQNILTLDKALTDVNKLVIAEHLRNFSWINYFLHQDAESEHYIIESINLKKTILKYDSFIMILSYADQARLYTLEQDYEKADALYKETLKLCDLNINAINAKPVLLKNYANLLLDMGRYSEANECLTKAYDLESSKDKK